MFALHARASWKRRVRHCLRMFSRIQWRNAEIFTPNLRSTRANIAPHAIPARFATVLCLALLQSNLPAADPQWQHLSSTNGDLPAPGPSTEQTACVLADFDKDGTNDFVLGFRQTAPALVWYRRKP